MNSFPPETYRHAHSTAWISPEGEFEPLDGEMGHDDASAFFPSVPHNEDYPSNFAVSKLGYIKVSNPFEMLWDRLHHSLLFTRPRRLNRETQLRSMAQFTADAILSYKKKGKPSWINEKSRDPADWEFRILDPNLPMETTTVAEFIDENATPEVKDRFFDGISPLHEVRLRRLVRQVISESFPKIIRSRR